MKKINLILAALLIAPILLTTCNKDEKNGYPFQFRFLTENIEPFNFIEDGEITGLAPGILERICENLDIPLEIEVLNWDDAYELALETENAVLFSTSLIAERKDLFNWVGPIASMDWYFYARAQNNYELLSLEDAKEVNSIGVVRDYSIEQYLVSKGFDNLVYCNNQQEAFGKLLNGEIDLYPSDQISGESTLITMGLSIYSIKEVLPIRTELIYFAFNKSIPPDVTDDFQREIDVLKNDGFLKTVYQEYMNSSRFPGVLQFYTEEYPPLTFLGNYGEIKGYGTDVVKEIMKRNGLFADIRLSTWNNGYELALINPNFCLFTMDWTESRAPLFHWIGPIGTNTTYFYTRAGSGISIGSLEEARALASVATVNSWFSDQYLRELGFTNLVSDSDPLASTEKLMKGEVDAFVCSGITFPDILRNAGYEYSQVTPAFPLLSSDYYISFSRSTDEGIINQWQSTFSAIQTDGTLGQIRGKWFPE